MKSKSQVEVITVSIKLFEQHLAQAIDELRRALDGKPRENHDDFIVEWRLSTSSILHAVSALESLVNYFGFELYQNKKSENYVSENDRSFALKKVVRSWNNSPLLDKLNLILEQSYSQPLDHKLENEFQELNTLRNWLIHGTPYSLTYLHELIWESEDNVRGIIHDVEDTIDWKRKFPNTKFNPPGNVQKEDAKKAFEIVLKIVLVVLKKFWWFHTTLKMFHNGVHEYWLDGNTELGEMMNKLGIT